MLLFLLVFQLLGLLEIVRLTLFFPSLLFLDLKGTIARDEYLMRNINASSALSVFTFIFFQVVGQCLLV
jgi:hypothetical protein